ncbi:MAG TPA: AAA family ATPase, partial [Myxococcota bacterium]|nr:AAA family ATPase [Myxococcota bacterium]
IQFYLRRYADFDFDIDYKEWTIRFQKGGESHIKVSRGEENIFIWCLFMAICERVIDGSESYAWVKFLYIDDPISSLDDNNAIAVANDLARLLRKGTDRWKVVISSHHALFFNVICNELKASKSTRYFLHRPDRGTRYTLRSTDATPFFHHVAMLSELQGAAASGELFAYHFNMLRSILEKTATFFGYSDFSACFEGEKDELLYSRALNIMSHGKYSIYAPQVMVDDNKVLFREILSTFLQRYRFALPEILGSAPTPAVPPAPLPENEAPETTLQHRPKNRS